MQTYTPGTASILGLLLDFDGLYHDDIRAFVSAERRDGYVYFTLSPTNGDPERRYRITVEAVGDLL